MSVDRDRLARIIVSGIRDIEEWRLGDPELAKAKGYPREFPAELLDDYGMLFIDLTLDAADGSLVCHEVNGPNAVGSDALTGDSTARAENEARQAVRRVREFGYVNADGSLGTKVVTVHAHQHWQFFRTGGEFFPRVARFADILESLVPGNTVSCLSANDALGEDDVSVVMGDVPAVCANITVNPQNGMFEYLGRPIVFMGNPNLIPELERIGRVSHLCRTSGEVNLRPMHAWRLCGLVHDKAGQQDLFDNTGVRPLRHFTAGSVEEALQKSKEMLATGPVVLKPSDTSGGTGVCVVVPGMTDSEILGALETLQSECREKYGENIEDVIFPVQGFEFVRATSYPMDDGDHLWDLRMAVLFEPGKAFAYPVSLRLTPEPFDNATFHTNRRQWISNVSGRRETLLKSGMDDDVLRKVGMTDELMEQAMKACVRWTMKAWDCTVRDGGNGGAVYEDFCEEADKPFYRPEKFKA